MAGVIKWRFVDPHPGASPSSYTFLINPNAMNSPFPKKAVQIAGTTAVTGQGLASEAATPPLEWTFSGVILHQTQLDAFNTWMQKRVRIYIYDHYERRYTAYLTSFEPSPGRKSRTYPWRHRVPDDGPGVRLPGVHVRAIKTSSAGIDVGDPPAIWHKWLSGHHLGQDRPMGRVTVQRAYNHRHPTNKGIWRNLNFSFPDRDQQRLCRPDRAPQRQVDPD